MPNHETPNTAYLQTIMIVSIARAVIAMAHGLDIPEAALPGGFFPQTHEYLPSDGNSGSRVAHIDAGNRQLNAAIARQSPLNEFSHFRLPRAVTT